MLSEENYKALLRFRNGLVKYDKKLTEREELLLHYGLIRIVKRKEATNGDGYTMTYIQDYMEITVLGKDAISEFEKSVKQTEKTSHKNHEENKNALQKIFHFLKVSTKTAWALFTCLGTIVTVFGWPWILRFFAFLRSLF